MREIARSEVEASEARQEWAPSWWGLRVKNNDLLTVVSFTRFCGDAGLALVGFAEFGYYLEVLKRCGVAFDFAVGG